MLSHTWLLFLSHLHSLMLLGVKWLNAERTAKEYDVPFSI